MMQKRSTLSLLLISFILVFALSVSAQEVTFESKDAARCETSVLNITVDNSTDVGAVEVVFEITGTGGSFFDAMSINWDAGLVNLTNRIVDMSGVDNVSPDTVRIAAMLIDAGDVCLTVGQTVIAQVEYTTNDNCAGVIVLSGATVSPSSFNVSTQFVDCAGTAVISAVVNVGSVTVDNQNPTIASIADGELAWGETYVGNAVGDDFDLANSCESLTYSVVSGPATLTVNATSGTINWVTTGADVCTHDVEIQVEDACGATASTSFTICVTNAAPSFTDTPDAEVILGLGDTFTYELLSEDSDGGPAAPLYALINDGGAPGSPTVDAATGIFTWVTLFEDVYRGSFTFDVTVTDGANLCDPCSPTNADTVSFTIVVNDFLIVIQRDSTLQGQEKILDISGIVDLNPGVEDEPVMGGFDFLVQYDPTALTFQFAEMGEMLVDCEWEYFTYRYGANGNCAGSACPTGIVRIVAIAETNNGSNHPDCFATDYDGDESDFDQLVKLHFLVTNDRTFDCMYAPVRFFWYDCGDNTISSEMGNDLYISHRVFEHEVDEYGANPIYSNDITDLTADFPTLFGAPDTCDIETGVDKPNAIRCITFVNGGVDIICADSIDGRGDLNLNEIAYEIADAVLYSNYFVLGTSVFTVNPDGQIAASDVNADGLTLSVADLVYMIRVLVGDAQPYPKEAVNEASFVNANYKHHNGVIAVDEDMKIAAAHIIVEGNVVPTLLADNMNMVSNFDGTNTRVLVYSLENNSFSGAMINVGDNNIVSMDMADDQGNQVVAKWIPSNFGLAQNYPNPFNPTTTVSFSVPFSSDVTLTIYNVNGQRVTEFSGTYEAGVHSIEWDASATASGIYFYRLNAGNFSDVKKMVLLK